ncbi:MAG: hypothetical protein RLZZ558_208 [Planctomycetota bacterium]
MIASAGAASWRIAHSTGWRRAAWLAALLLASWLAAIVVGTFVATLTNAGGMYIHAAGSGRPMPTGMAFALKFLDTWWIAIVGTARSLLPGQDLPLAAQLAFVLLLMGLVVSPMLICVPLVGLGARQGSGIPLRWSIAGAGSLGGLISVGMLVVMLDIPRVLMLWSGQSIAWGLPWLGEVELVALILLTWVVAGAIWASLLARAGMSGDPDRIVRFVRRLFAGTCVELALAAPTYAAGMRKESCWCSWGSFWAIVGGSVVLTTLCGPMLVLLWTRRARLHWIRRACPACGYPRRGGVERCPECGHVFTAVVAQ